MGKLEDVGSYGKSFKGKSSLLWHLEGKRISPTQAISAKCYDCMGYYVDGVSDCEVRECSLYPFNPYSKSRVKRPDNRSEEAKQRSKDALIKARLVKKWSKS